MKRYYDVLEMANGIWLATKTGTCRVYAEDANEALKIYNRTVNWAVDTYTYDDIENGEKIEFTDANGKKHTVMICESNYSSLEDDELARMMDNWNEWDDDSLAMGRELCWRAGLAEKFDESEDQFETVS